MRCVSYTRTTSSDPYSDIPRDTIKQQNDLIAGYIKKNGWKLCGRYSDRKKDKNEDSDFQRMREALLRREYECVVVDSLYHMASDLYLALSFIRKTLVPAGIWFAVAEDEFCSKEKTVDEVDAYLSSVRGKYQIHGKYQARRTKENYFKTFGFSFDENENRALIDTESAAIVREIFERMAGGELQGSIAQDLEKRGVTNPHDYYYSARGKTWSGEHGWSTKIINSIIEDPKYMGKYEGGFDMAEVTLPNSPIVTEELYRKIAEMRDEWKNEQFGIHSREAIKKPFTGLMIDKETGNKLCCVYRNGEHITFSYPKANKLRYEYGKSFMPLDQFEALLNQRLKQEKEKSERVIEILGTETGRQKREEAMEKLRKQGWKLFQKAESLEDRKMREYKRLRAGKIKRKDYVAVERSCNEKLLTLDKEMIKLTNQMDQIDKIFSERNPWLRLYSGFDPEEELTGKKLRRLVGKIMVHHFQAVEIIPKKLEYRDRLPAEWMEVNEHGKDQ